MKEIYNVDYKLKARHIPSIMVGVPCHRTVEAYFMKSCLQLQQLFDKKNIPLKFNFLIGDSLITRARNRIVDEFMKSDDSHLMFIDSDIEFDPNDVLKLLDLNLPVVAGPYPLKQISWQNVKNAILHNPNINTDELQKVTSNFVLTFKEPSFSINTPTEVFETGTGFLMIKREVFVELQKGIIPHKECHNSDGVETLVYGYFNTGLNSQGRFLSEDYHFCKLYRDIGGKIMVLPNVKLNHIGTYVYQGNIPAMAAMENK